MTREKMTAMLAETICVTPEEAQAALEAREWRLLDAAELLQQDRARAAKAAASRRIDRKGSIVSAVRDRIGRAARACFAPRPDDPAVQALSAATLAPLMLMPTVYASRCW